MVLKIVMAFSAIFILLHLIALVEGQYCGQCFCHPEQDILICSGTEVVSFPALSLYDMNRLDEIILEETRITSLPMHQITEYVSLKRFVDKNNAFILCPDIYAWRAELLNVTFHSPCFATKDSTVTEVILSTTITSEKFFSSQSITEKKTMVSIGVSNHLFSPSPHNLQKSTEMKRIEETTEGNYTFTPFPISADEEEVSANKIIIALLSLLIIVLGLASVAIVIYRRYIKRTTSNRSRLVSQDNNSLFELREYRVGIYNPTTTDSEV